MTDPFGPAEFADMPARPQSRARLSLAAGLLLSLVSTCGEARPALTPTRSMPPSGWSRYTLVGGGGQTGIAIDPRNTQVIYVTTDNAGIVKTTDGGATWASVINNLGNRMLADVELDPLDPQVVYVAAEVYKQRPSWNDDPATGELYRSRDGAATWEVVYAEGTSGDGRSFAISQWPSTRNLLIPYDPADPGRYDADRDSLTDVLYVGGWDEATGVADPRGGVWKSVDEGATFTQMGLADKQIWVLRQKADDPETLYAGTYGAGLWVSHNGGVTWETWRDRLPIPMVSDIVSVPGRTALYVAINTFYSPYAGDEFRKHKGIYRSLDGGSHFEPINTGLERTSLDFTVLALDASDLSGQTLYAGTWHSDVSGVFQTRDGGESWRLMAFEQAASPFWFDSFANPWALASAQDGTLFAASWRGVYQYDRERREWRIRSQGLGNITVETVALEPGRSDILYVGLLDSQPWKSVDGGASWRLIGNGFSDNRSVGASDLAIAPSHPHTIYATGIGASGKYLSLVNKTQDGGAHWKPIMAGLPETSAETPQWRANAIAVSNYDADVAYVALEYKAGGGGIYKTEDGGQNWRQVLTLNDRPLDLDLSAHHPETVICVTHRGWVHIGEGGGQRWRASQATDGLIYAVDVYPRDHDRILVGANVNGAFLTIDGGRTWRQVFGKAALAGLVGDRALSPFARAHYWPTIRAVRFDPADPETLYLGHNPRPWIGVGVVMSTDSGQHWRALADSNFQLRSVSDFDLDPISKNLVVGTGEVYYYRSGPADETSRVNP